MTTASCLRAFVTVLPQNKIKRKKNKSTHIKSYLGLRKKN